MNNIISLSCPSCGGKLDVTSDTDQLVCGFCGQRNMVKREGGAISLAPVLEAMNQVKAGVDRTNAELAIVRLQKEIDELTNNRSTLLRTNPKPVPTASLMLWAILAIVVGGLMFLGFICNAFANGFSSSVAGMIIGLLIGGFGVLLLWLRGQPKKGWEKKIAPQIAAMDQQIAKDNQELQQFKIIVSS